MPREEFYTIGRNVLILAMTVLSLSRPAPANSGQTRVETLRSVAAIPPDIAGRLEEPAGFVQLPSGDYLLFDRRGHTVFRVDRELTAARPLVRIGVEPGRILLPFGFDLDPTGLLVLGDAPGRGERIQVFETDGTRLGGFSLPPRPEARMQFDGVMFNGITTLRATARQTVLLNQPETGSLITEYDFDGHIVRSIGRLRATGHEATPAVHLALNSGLPLPVPSSGYYFVFQSGEPHFQRYSASGALMFDRAIQGRELDLWLQNQPTSWSRTTAADDRTAPVVRPLVRAAAVDRDGNLWVSFRVPYTYVYDEEGEKRRTLQLHGGGPLVPISLSFAPDGRLLVTPGGYIFKP